MLETEGSYDWQAWILYAGRIILGCQALGDRDKEKYWAVRLAAYCMLIGKVEKGREIMLYYSTAF